MGKPNKRHKEKCKQYQMEGRREKNKAIKAERHERRMAKFAKRREEGKAYEYTPNPYEPGTREYNTEAYKRAQKNVDRRVPQAWWDSRWRKLNNEIEAEKEREWKQQLSESK